MAGEIWHILKVWVAVAYKRLSIIHFEIETFKLRRTVQINQSAY